MDMLTSTTLVNLITFMIPIYKEASYKEASNKNDIRESGQRLDGRKSKKVTKSCSKKRPPQLDK